MEWTLLYVFLGITATGVIGALALLGGAAIVAALWLAPRSRRTATGLLVTGALPFGIVAWWSIVAPLAAAAVIAIGVPQIRHPIARAGR